MQVFDAYMLENDLADNDHISSYQLSPCVMLEYTLQDMQAWFVVCSTDHRKCCQGFYQLGIRLLSKAIYTW